MVVDIQAKPNTENPARVRFTPSEDSNTEVRVSLEPLDPATALKALLNTPSPTDDRP